MVLGKIQFKWKA